MTCPYQGRYKGKCEDCLHAEQGNCEAKEYKKHKGLPTKLVLIPERMKRERMVRGLTLRDVARETGIAYGTMRAYENGNASPREPTIEKIAVALRVTAEQITRLEV